MSLDPQQPRLTPEQWLGLMRSRRLYRLRLPAEQEAGFRRAQRTRYRYPRSIVFGVHALGFGLAPLIDTALFAPSTEVLPLLRQIELQLMLPILLLATLAPLLRVPVFVQQSVQTLAVFALGVATLGLRHLALLGEMHYPSQMLGVVLVAVALFGGFSSRRIAAATVLLTGLAVAQEYRLAAGDGHPHIEVYSLLLLGLIAMLGTYTIEIINRLNWLGYQYANSLARTDALTGLSNRHDFNRMFPRVLQLAVRERRTVAVMLIDIDHFKSINDRHGHPFGDEVLRAVGRALDGQIARRPLDLLARYGGEELVVVWYDVQPLAVPALIDGVLEAIRQVQLSLPMSQERLRLTASAGCVCLRPGTLDLPEALLRRADELLYKAKAAGRDCRMLESVTGTEAALAA